MNEENISVRLGKLQSSMVSNLITPILTASIILILLSFLFFLFKIDPLGYILFGTGIISFILWLLSYVWWQIKDPSKLRSGEFEINKIKAEKKKPN